MTAGTRFGVALTTVLAAVAIAALPAGAGAASKAPSAKLSSCSLSQSEINGGLGASYVYELKANFDCAKAKKLTKEFHQCRHNNGGANGHCSSFKGYSCNEKKIDSSPQILQAKATCKKGSKKFKQTFGETL